MRAVEAPYLMGLPSMTSSFSPARVSRTVVVMAAVSLGSFASSGAAGEWKLMQSEPDAAGTIAYVTTADIGRQRLGFGCTTPEDLNLTFSLAETSSQIAADLFTLAGPEVTVSIDGIAFPAIAASMTLDHDKRLMARSNAPASDILDIARGVAGTDQEIYIRLSVGSEPMDEGATTLEKSPEALEALFDSCGIE